jgi:hypothetical protein
MTHTKFEFGERCIESAHQDLLQHLAEQDKCAENAPIRVTLDRGVYKASFGEEPGYYMGSTKEYALLNMINAFHIHKENLRKKLEEAGR